VGFPFETNRGENRTLSSRAGSAGVNGIVVNFDSCNVLFSLVTEPLISRFHCLNIHPALLPAFKGMGAVDRPIEGSCRFLGATLHMADR